MDGQGQVSFGFPRPGRALTAILIVIGVLGVLQAFLNTWAGAAFIFEHLECNVSLVRQWQLWRLVTSGVLTSPEQFSHLVYTLIGLYFLGTDLERRWGAWRFVRFLALSVIVGNLVAIAMGELVPEGAQARFHPQHMYGALAAITGIAIAWSRENADLTVRFLFVIPMRGKILFWVTIGFCVLDLIYPMSIPEGIVAPFGGVLVGLLIGSTPSVARTLYLRSKLALLRRRRGGGLRAHDLIGSEPRSTPRRSRAGDAPPLRVVQGGLEDALRKRKPPKDKRYLN